MPERMCRKEGAMKPEVDVYRKLQKHLDNMPIAFPESDSGLDIELLRQRFTPEEAKIALALSALPETLERVYRRLKKTGISIQELEKTLDDLTTKGSILGGKFFERKGNKKHYSKAPLAIGMYELQAGRLTKEFEKAFQDYANEKFIAAFHSKKTSQMRTIPINRGLNAERYVDTYDNAREIIQKTDRPMAVIQCVCRSGKDLMETPCRHSDIRDTCLIFEDTAAFAVSLGAGRFVSKDEMLEILARAEDAGFVLQPENNRKPNFICCCCGCCCNVLTSVKKFPKPVEFYHSNFQAFINPEKCDGCKICIDRCPMEAISSADGSAFVDLDRCIGCGACVPVCPSNACELRKKDTAYVPPKDSDAMYQKILMERVGISGMLKIVPRIVFGLKI
jgi:Na+-translocating ferredoxin:NAD+ oxidoreductase subunit B